VGREIQQANCIDRCRGMYSAYMHACMRATQHTVWGGSLRGLYTTVASPLNGTNAPRGHLTSSFKESLMVISQTHRDREGIATSAAGMIGVAWTKGDEELDR